MRPGSLEYRFGTDGSEEDSQRILREIVGRLDQHHAGLIVGTHGSGKTTLLHSLAPRLSETFAEIANVRLFAPPSRGMLDRLRHARRSAKTVHNQQARLRDGGLLVIDGLEQLWHADLMRLLRKIPQRGQTLLATSHSPLPGMAILHQTHVNGKLVASLTQSLLSGVSPKVAQIVHRELQQQDWSRLTNVRDLWFELYDVVQPHIQQSLYSSLRIIHDGRSTVRHHGSHGTPDAGCRADS